MPSAHSTWNFLTNHAHVLLTISQEPDITVRRMAQLVGITERAVMRIIGELDEAGILVRERHGRRNRYTVNGDVPFRHPIERHCTVACMIDMYERAQQRQGSAS